MEDDLTRLTWSCIWGVCQLDGPREYARNLAEDYDLAVELARSLEKFPSADWKELGIVSEFMEEFERKYSKSSTIERRLGKYGLPDGYRFKQDIAIVHITKNNPNERGFNNVKISGEYVPARDIYEWLFNK